MANILLISKNYPPVICGVGDHTRHLSRELGVLGNKTFILTGTRQEKPGENMISVDTFGPSMYRQLKSTIKTNGVNCVLWQYVPYSYHRKGLPFWWPVIMFRLKLQGTRQVVIFHEVSVRLRGYGVMQMGLAFFQRLIANTAALAANRTITSIPLFRKYFLLNRPTIVPISANIQASGKGVLQVPNQLFCFANRADEALIKAVKAVNEIMPVQLILGGKLSCNQQRQITSWITTNGLNDVAVITGSISAPLLAEYMEASVMIIQPQVVERKYQGGISAKNGTVMAAIGMGKPIITCRGDMTDPGIFKNNSNILLVSYGDALAYKNAILTVLKNPEYALKLGAAAAETYRKQCSWEVTAGKIGTICNIGIGN